MSDESPTRKPEPPSTNAATVTGYHLETDLAGSTDITLTLRKGGTVPLHGLEPAAALLYLNLLHNSGPRLHAIWKPETRTLDWRNPGDD